MSNFQRALYHGRVGESYIAQYLRKRYSLNILPVYEVDVTSGKGPVLYTQSDEKRVCPDMLAFSSDVCNASTMLGIQWIEAKTKSAFTWHRKTNEWITGIDLHHYQQYLLVQRETPFPVYLFFLHLRGRAKDTPQGMTGPTGLFCGSLAYLAEHEHHRWADSQDGQIHGMVYWSHGNLKKIADLSEVVADDIGDIDVSGLPIFGEIQSTTQNEGGRY